jgi:hypothetical protein
MDDLPTEALPEAPRVSGSDLSDVQVIAVARPVLRKYITPGRTPRTLGKPARPPSGAGLSKSRQIQGGMQ